MKGRRAKSKIFFGIRVILWIKITAGTELLHGVPKR